MSLPDAQTALIYHPFTPPKIGGSFFNFPPLKGGRAA